MSINLEACQPLPRPDSQSVTVWQKDKNGRRVGDVPIPVKADYWLHVVVDAVQLVAAQLRESAKAIWGRCATRMSPFLFVFLQKNSYNFIIESPPKKNLSYLRQISRREKIVIGAAEPRFAGALPRRLRRRKTFEPF
jgi:hypothetical protein